jgi:hypothetical protein
MYNRNADGGEENAEINKGWHINKQLVDWDIVFPLGERCSQDYAEDVAADFSAGTR